MAYIIYPDDKLWYHSQHVHKCHRILHRIRNQVVRFYKHAFNEICHYVIYVFRQTSDISRTLEDNKIVDHSDVVGASPYITFFAIYTQKGWARTWASLCVPISKHLTLGHPQTRCRLHISKVIARSYIFNVTSLLIRWYFSTWLTDEILRNLAPSRVLGPMGKKLD